MDEKILTRDVFISLLKIHILQEAQLKPVYGKDYQKKLAELGYEISFGTIYPLFHKLEKWGMLKAEEFNVSGKVRKYYSTTFLGKIILRETKENVSGLLSLLLGIDSKVNKNKEK